MATSRRKGGCWISFPDDDERDDSGAIIIQGTALVEASAGDIPSTPPRRSTAFGLETPLATPDSRSRLHAIDYCFTSPAYTPPRLRDIPKDTKPLTFPRKLSEQPKESTASITLQSSAGLPTPENTPPRELRPTSPREETKVKSESSPLRNATSRSTVLGLETPLATPDCRSRQHVIDYYSTSPPCTPPRLRDSPKDTKPLTFPRKLSEQSKEFTASITFPSSAGLPTPENTPPRKLRPTSPREETKVKLESSPLRNTIPSATEAM
jgi:hypothetical protein